MKVRHVLLGLLVSLPLSGWAQFMDVPYLEEFAQCEFRPLVGGYLYDRVSNLKDPASYKSHDLHVDLNLGMRFLPNIEAEVEVDFTRTSLLPFGLQLVGFQGRYQLLDGFGSDLVSLVLGARAFFVPTRNMRDFSSPYHAQGNIEVNCSCGKEWFGKTQYAMLLWGVLGVGQGNRGLPWIRPELHLDVQLPKGSASIYGKSYIGLGRIRDLVLSQFDRGYGDIMHRSIDLGVRYVVDAGVWGDLSLNYEYRVWAYSFPAKANTFYLLYQLPFSVF